MPEIGATTPDYLIGASVSYAIVTGHNGCLQFEVTVHGTATHGVRLAQGDTSDGLCGCGAADPVAAVHRYCASADNG